jgi:2-polyprenyl-3-methyl-5-hydroxy-6-metoxy-1,4-benzoquinol methylase
VAKFRNFFTVFFRNRFNKNLLAEIKYLNLKSILDAGCGEGNLIKFLKKNELAEYIEGIEVSEEQIQRARKLNPHLIIKKGDIYDIPGKTNSFDLVISTQVFEHLKYPRRALKEMARVSNKYLLISVYNEAFFKIGKHENHWSPAEFKKFVNARGLKIVSKKSPYPWTMILLKKV